MLMKLLKVAALTLIPSALLGLWLLVTGQPWSVWNDMVRLVGPLLAKSLGAAVVLVAVVFVGFGIVQWWVTKSRIQWTPEQLQGWARWLTAARYGAFLLILCSLYTFTQGWYGIAFSAVLVWFLVTISVFRARAIFKSWGMRSE